MKKPSLILLIILLALYSCRRTREAWHTTTLLYFDTVCELQILCAPEMIEPSLKEVNRVFTEIEKFFSPDSVDFSSPLVLRLFDTANQFYRDSKGFFDVSVGSLSSLWELCRKGNRIPSKEEFGEALISVGMNKVRREAASLVLQPGMKLDWGGIAKGFGIDLASNSLVSMGISSGFINAGGDLFCWGKNPSHGLWRVGIKHPREMGFLGILSLTDVAVATSGDYQRFFEVGMVRYHHILNPFTGYPAPGKQSVTVIGPSATHCDALSTALFVSPDPEKILEKYPEYDAIIVDEKGKVEWLGKRYFFSQI